MEEIIQPVEKELLLAELTKDNLLRNANHGNNEIYLFDGRKSPYLMKELGRLRELTFRHAGGGTGKETDIDKYDIGEDPYLQLIVWDPEDKEIVGGYRYILGESILDNPLKKLATSHLFGFSDKFLKQYLPYTIELGRSFIQPAYQAKSNVRKGLFALDNLWDGLGALMVEYPIAKYFLGKVTMYKTFNVEARNYILSFLNIYFSDKKNLLISKNPIIIDYNKYTTIFSKTNYLEDYKILNKIIKRYDEKIPPLINAYMNLSRSLIFFGTVENDEFGGVEETGILVNIQKMYNIKKDRHTNSYKKLININELFPRDPKTLDLKFLKKLQENQND